MRSAIIGVFYADDQDRLLEFARASAELTHRDPRAIEGAVAIAVAAACAVNGLHTDANGVLKNVLQHLKFDDLRAPIEQIGPALAANKTTAEFAASIGCQNGVSGFVCHTVPAALFCWLRAPTDARQAIESVIRLGGDTDTVAAITGALAGAGLGEGGLPTEWVDGLTEWPRSVEWMRRLAARLSEEGGEPLRLFWPGVLVRNLAFIAIVLVHVVRRLLPPW